MGEKVEELLEAVTDMALHGQEAQSVPDKALHGQEAQSVPDKALHGQKAQNMPDSVGRAEMDFAQFSPLDLAYIGDAVYDLIIRKRVVLRMGSRQVNKLHRETIHYVNAGAQSRLMQELLPRLTPQETRIYKRGRNAVSHTVPKNQDVGDYRRATGFEALIGWLFLCGNYERIWELLAGVGEDIGTETAKPEAKMDATLTRFFESLEKPAGGHTADVGGHEAGAAGTSSDVGGYGVDTAGHEAADGREGIVTENQLEAESTWHATDDCGKDMNTEGRSAAENGEGAGDE